MFFWRGVFCEIKILELKTEPLTGLKVEEKHVKEDSLIKGRTRALIAEWAAKRK